MHNQHTVLVYLHTYINAKYILHLHNTIIENNRANVSPIRTCIERVDWPITEHAGWSTLMSDVTTCTRHDSVGGGERHWLLVTLQWTCCLHSPHAAASLVYLLLHSSVIQG